MIEAQISKYRRGTRTCYRYTAKGHGRSAQCIALSTVEGSVCTHLGRLGEDPRNRDYIKIRITSGDGALMLDTDIDDHALLYAYHTVDAMYDLLDSAISHINVNGDANWDDIRLVTGSDESSAKGWREDHDIGLIPMYPVQKVSK